jgi:hypothetical protein
MSTVEELERRIEMLEELMQTHQHSFHAPRRRTENLEYDRIMAEVEYEHG